MLPKSLRWRLPLSYAAIACFAALAAGVVLLTTLRSFYLQREQEYVNRQAFAVSRALSFAYNQGVTLDEIRQNFPALALFTQAQVQLYDQDGNLIADSGLPNDTRMDFFFQSAAPAMFAGQTSPVPVDEDEPPFTRQLFTVQTEPVPDDGIQTWVQPIEDDFTMPIGGFNFGVDAEMSQSDIRSDQTARSGMMIFNNASPLGYITVSQGPAYGRAILSSVFLGWMIASGFAIILAAGAGWIISRRITAPLISLTAVTGHMAKGDLSARAQVTGQDEVGFLAHSFNEMANRVEETVRTLRRFVADAAHEIHTPLTALNTNLELAASESDDAKRQTFIQHAKEQLQRLEALTINLLNLSRLETDSARDEPSKVDVIALVRQTSELYASQAEQRGILFNFDLSADTVVFHASEAQLRCALENLLENALKFTPENGTITVGVSQQKNEIKLWVRDTGIGIPPEDLPHVFSRFHRGRNAAAYPGSGLGLAILKAIAERHAGQVQVESQLGEGTYFAVQLPL